MTAVTFRREQEVADLFAGLPMISVFRRVTIDVQISIFPEYSGGGGLAEGKDWFIT